MFSRKLLTGWMALLAGGAAACAEHGESSRFTVRDSAGVEIVESRAAAGLDAAAWSVDAPPLLEIGVEEGSTEYQFSRVEGAVRLPGGRIVVADAGSREIRFFDSEGHFLSASGRRGDAPGEYRQIIALGEGPGDSIWVFDYGVRRFTVLTEDGRVARTLTLDPTLSNVGAVGRLADGSFVVREFWWAGGGGGEIRLGLRRDPAALARYSPDGATLDTIGLFLGREVYIGTEGGRGVMSTPLFAHGTSAAVRDDEIFIGDQERFEIGVYSAEGVLRRLIRLTHLDLRVTRTDIERATEQRLASVRAEQRVAMRAHLAAMDVPATRPAYGRLLVDSEGNLWVGDYAAYSDDPVLWRVFGAGGRLVTALRVPDRFRIYDIGADWVLGVWRDDFDVEHIRLYNLRKDG